MRNALSKINYIILSIGSILIITGYVLMSGEGSTPAAYNPDIFSKLQKSNRKKQKNDHLIWLFIRINSIHYFIFVR